MEEKVWRINVSARSVTTEPVPESCAVRRCTLITLVGVVARKMGFGDGAVATRRPLHL